MKKITARQEKLGREMYRLISELYPICRSVTGNGVRQTLAIIGKYIPLKIYEVPSGTQVFDWSVPKEWNITDAYVKNSKGKKVIDFKKSNLHIVNYSVPVKKKIKLEELKKHLFSLPQQPDLIPYKTTYYKEDWGFCLSYKQLRSLSEDEYEVFIDSSLTKGSLSYSEYYLKGLTDDEVLISCHICHPSLCNDNLSGIALAAFLAKYLSKQSLRYSYRFLFIPGAIGSITWLALNRNAVKRIKNGLVLSGVGDSGQITYKKSRQGNAEIDQVAMYVLENSRKKYKIIDFTPFGYDERQYCSPGFNLPIGCLSRSLYGTYPQYHTSADNLDFVRSKNLSDSYAICLQIIETLEKNRYYQNLNPQGELQLGKRGLYEAMDFVSKETKLKQMAMLWVLNLSDGYHSLLDIAKRAGIKFDIIYQVVNILLKYKLLKEI